jgi:hypothetical protein
MRFRNWMLQILLIYPSVSSRRLSHLSSTFPCKKSWFTFCCLRSCSNCLGFQFHASQHFLQTLSCLLLCGCVAVTCGKPFRSNPPLRDMSPYMSTSQKNPLHAYVYLTGAAFFLRSCQSLSYSKLFQNFMKRRSLLPPSQELSIGTYTGPN